MGTFHVLTILNLLISVFLVAGFLNVRFELSEKESLNNLLLQNYEDGLRLVQQDFINEKRLNQLSLSDAQYNSLIQEMNNRDLYTRRLLNEKSTKSETRKLDNKLENVDFKAGDFSQVIEESMKGIVKITITIPVKFKEMSKEPKQGAEIALRQLGFAMDGSDKPEESVLPVIGSGSLISRSGLVLTNRHVANAEKEICSDEFAQQFFTCTGPATMEVMAVDGKKSSASIDKLSDKYDIALLKTDLRGKPLSLSQSGIGSGTDVVVLGNPQDIDFSAAKGIVSGVDRDLHDGLGNFWLQTDAPINEGNSGGPLIDKNGEIVGIATLKLGNPFSSIEGLGFAIPSRVIRQELFS